jgi:signal transduction histidine kinase
VTSLRRHLVLTGAVLAVLVLVAGVVGALTFTALLRERRELVDRIDPAAVETQRLLAGLVDQEASLRGFALTGEEEFRRSYEDAVGAADAAREELDELVGDHPQLVTGLTAVDANVEHWRANSVRPLLQLGEGDDVTPGEQETTVELSRRRIDEVRAVFAELEADLDRLREEGRGELDRRTTVLTVVLLASLSGIAVYGTGVWVAARRLVIGPIDRLRQDAVSVSWGDLHHEVTPSGPRELCEVGEAVEAMRQRMVADLELVEHALEELEQRADDLTRSNRDLEQFAYVASHDLQEPLRKVASFCQLLQQRYAGQLDERADQYIAFAVDGAKRMQGLINDLLAFSRVGRTTDRFVPVDLSQVLDGVLADLAPLLEEHGGTVERPTSLPVVSGDRSLLGNLLLNLVGNSIKFRGEDPPRVCISAEPHDEGWCFTIADNGIGIEPQYAERVFVIFQRLHGRDRYEGTGIGLALCRKIVEFHGGHIWVADQTGPGTTIHWTLPAADDADTDDHEDDHDDERSAA